ncbi:TIR domain-containing protein [Vibrio campbellii]|uniref:TIR domain-containing protein n=1 Tax=Vibrio campbellii TaxID=680 RepID=A0AAQ2Y2C2_9VIBR|nr:toll/interleukin-1 receptor domain-containing protein [Vibrio campbellii]WDG09694.1 TIR domain-containing protein [Vibrio campbellii]
MNVFLSWSGNRSKAVAELLDEWLQCVIQAVDPWMSSKDIDRGSLWFSEINDQLQNTTIGIICLTQENKNKPWILFEAGALAKGLSESRVCTFLVDLNPTDVGTPLSQFNHTFPSKEGLWELVRTLNNSLKDKGLKEKILEQVFETYWPQFEREFKAILKNHPSSENVEKRSDDDILLEILSTTRSMDKRVRILEQDTNNSRTINFAKVRHEPRPNIENSIRHLIARGESESDIITKIAVDYEVPKSVVHSILVALDHNIQ